MLDPGVSVIIPAYNRKNYLKYAVNSVLNQTYTDFELIIVDDGSTDGTGDMVRSYNDLRIKYIYQNNQGNHSARNTGIKNAKGKYIALLDSDDMWHAEKLEKQVNILEKHSDIGLVYCGTLLVDENNNLFGKKPLIRHSGYVLDKLLMNNFLYNGSNPLIRQECIKKAGLFDEHLKRMLDWDFYLRIALYFKFHAIKEYLVLYRVHDESLSAGYKSYETAGHVVLNKIFSNRDLDKKYFKLKDKAFARRYRYMGLRYFEAGLLEESRENFKKALNYDFSLSYRSEILMFLIFSYLPAEFINKLRSLKRTIELKKLMFSRQRFGGNNETTN